MRRNKYNAIKTVVDGYKFDSMKEARRYSELLLLIRAGEVTHFLRQVPFHIAPGVTYRLDFLVFWKDGRVTYEDVKGFRTPMYKTKKKLVEHNFPVEITEI